jgi:hypothetical protein
MTERGSVWVTDEAWVRKDGRYKGGRKKPQPRPPPTLPPPPPPAAAAIHPVVYFPYSTKKHES